MRSVTNFWPVSPLLLNVIYKACTSNNFKLVQNYSIQNPIYSQSMQWVRVYAPQNTSVPAKTQHELHRGCLRFNSPLIQVKWLFQSHKWKLVLIADIFSQPYPCIVTSILLFSHPLVNEPFWSIKNSSMKLNTSRTTLIFLGQHGLLPLLLRTCHSRLWKYSYINPQDVKWCFLKFSV